jgi:hypothetical protein
LTGMPPLRGGLVQVNPEPLDYAPDSKRSTSRFATWFISGTSTICIAHLGIAFLILVSPTTAEHFTDNPIFPVIFLVAFPSAILGSVSSLLSQKGSLKLFSLIIFGLTLALDLTIVTLVLTGRSVFRCSPALKHMRQELCAVQTLRLEINKDGQDRQDEMQEVGDLRH